jgi:hypothetical protein
MANGYSESPDSPFYIVPSDWMDGKDGHCVFQDDIDDVRTRLEGLGIPAKRAAFAMLPVDEERYMMSSDLVKEVEAYRNQTIINLAEVLEDEELVGLVKEIFSQKGLKRVLALYELHDRIIIGAVNGKVFGVDANDLRSMLTAEFSSLHENFPDEYKDLLERAVDDRKLRALLERMGDIYPECKEPLVGQAVKILEFELKHDELDTVSDNDLFGVSLADVRQHLKDNGCECCLKALGIKPLLA